MNDARARDIVEQMQHALLPSRLPALPRLDVAAGYVVGGAEQAAGGDWFEVVPRGDGTVAAVVGDVVGHGVSAAATMAQLRAVVLERLHAGVHPEGAVRALDHFVEIAPGGRSASVCIVEIDPATGEYIACSAGHPPPLVVEPSGGGRYLTSARGGLIGDGARRGTTPGRLPAGALLLLYSDGIVERPGVPAPAGVVELRELAAAALTDHLAPGSGLESAVDRVTTQALGRAIRHTGSIDDITLLALQPAHASPPLRLDRRLDHTGITAVRAAVRGWFRPGQVDPEALTHLDEVVTELCQNVVDHAYRGTGGPVAVGLDLREDATAALTVADRGRWREPAGHLGRGLGLALVRSLSARTTLHRGPDGTRVDVEMPMWKRATGTAPVAPPPPEDVADIAEDRHDGETVVWVRGAVDGAAADRLAAALTVATAPGRARVTVDLEEVTMLCSAAVRTLRDTRYRAGAVGVPVVFRCRRGSVADHVLALAGLPTVRRPN